MGGGGGAGGERGQGRPVRLPGGRRKGRSQDCQGGQEGPLGGEAVRHHLMVTPMTFTPPLPLPPSHTAWLWDKGLSSWTQSHSCVKHPQGAACPGSGRSGRAGRGNLHLGQERGTVDSGWSQQLRRHSALGLRKEPRLGRCPVEYKEGGRAACSLSDGEGRGAVSTAALGWFPLRRPH